MASKVEEWEFVLRKYVLMLATLVATVTYGVGFNPPGGVWQENDGPAGHRAGEPIIRSTNNLQYLVFFYCNAFALASSVLVIVLFLLLSIDLIEKKKKLWIKIRPLRVLMVLDLLSFMGAYAAGSCRDMLTTVYTSVLMAAGVSTYLMFQLLASRQESHLPAYHDRHREKLFRKALMLLATFALSIAYVSGLNLPGGFWDKTEGGHSPGEAILNNGHYKARLATFFICNSTAFMASLLIIMLLLGRKLHHRTVQSREMYGCILVALASLVGAYAACSSREPASTSYVVGVVAVGLVCILLQQVFHCMLRFPVRRFQRSHGYPISLSERIKSHISVSLLLLLASFATAITYQAGLHPPGGVWQENGKGHLAGDPILSTMNASRYRTFLYCNSFAFAFSLVTILGFLNTLQLRIKWVQTLVILELFGLIGAYAAGACRDTSTSNAVMALGGAVLSYLVIHVIFFTMEQDGIHLCVKKNFYADIVEQAEVEMKLEKQLEKKRKLLYLLATLSMAMSYQAGLTPPGGFWLQDDNESGHQAGDPVLLYNHPRRYKAFFYCNSVSFMLSVTTMILLVSPVLYRPAIQSNALTLCTVAGLSCLLGAYGAGTGSTQHLTTSIGIVVLVAVAFLILLLLLLIFLVSSFGTTDEEDLKLKDGEPAGRTSGRARLKHLMLLGILVAGVTFQAGLDPPGGVWQQSDEAGSPVMLNMRRQQYLTFLYSNSTSFAASMVVIMLLLLQLLKEKLRLHVRVLRWAVLLDFLCLLVAYAAGSIRGGKSSMIIVSLAIPIVTYCALMVLARFVLPIFLEEERIVLPCTRQHRQTQEEMHSRGLLRSLSA